MNTQKSKRYAVVILEGGYTAVAKAKRWFKEQGVDLIDTGPSTIGLRDVPNYSIHAIKTAAENLGLRSLSCRGDYFVEEVVPSKPREKRASGINLSPKKWYFAEALEDRYPLVYVRALNSENQERQVWDVDLLRPDNSLPQRVLLSSQNLVKFGLRPATPDDFDEFDIPVPFSKYLVQGTADLAVANKENLKSFGIGTKKVSASKKVGVEVPPIAVQDFVELLQTQLIDWQPREAGRYEATVPDTDAVHLVNAIISEWAHAHKYPIRDEDATKDKLRWTYATPGYKNEKPVVIVEATRAAEDPEAIGPWVVSIISPAWNQQ